VPKDVVLTAQAAKQKGAVTLRRFEEDGVAMVALPSAEWEALVEELEDLEDALALAEARNKNEPGIPWDVAKQTLEGVHPVRAYREHRGLTQAELGAKVGVGQSAIAKIERGARIGRIELLAALARVLDAPLEVLVEPLTPAP
jgi:DNA-binding XRE family transcriptional regulator